ncbi:unnamed protein product [Sphagnum jensenii]|uniref:Uncharacterized protein n=1 Tax=Sphagnum jensenii TaxID=128206 RepID=A0ABP1AYE2_9BRYO
MGNALSSWFHKESLSPVVLVPPLFERPYFATRSRMAESSYDLLFSKLARARLFEMYFEEAGQVMASLILQPADDPRVDVTACVRAPFDGETPEGFTGEAVFRWQRDAMDPNTFMDVTVASSDSPFKLRACTYDATRGIGVFTVLPLAPNKRAKAAEDAKLGVRYASTNFTVGTTVSPLQYAPSNLWVPSAVWMAGKAGPITAGVQFKSAGMNYLMLELFGEGNWSYAVDYGVGGKGPLDPSFNFCVEVCDNSKLIASYYHHLVVQRRVKNPFELNEVVGITNYVDLGFEFEHRKDTGSQLPRLQVAGSWQANKNVLMKAKLGSGSSGLVLILKSWWQPSVTLSLAAVRDHFQGKTKLGFGLRVENFGGVSYERVDPNYVMLTPTKQHIAEGIMRETGKRPMLQQDGSSASLPVELRRPDDVM